jgi:hypothetical protein
VCGTDLFPPEVHAQTLNSGAAPQPHVSRRPDIRAVGEENPMSRYGGTFTVGAFAGALYLAGSLTSSATAEPPNFAPNRSARGWYGYSAIFIPPASGAGPLQQDPAHPYVTNDEFRLTGKQPTQRMGDINNPILQPWAREVVHRRNELVLDRKLVPSPSASCWPVGPTIFALGEDQPMYVIQGPRDVVLVLTSYNDVRHIHLTDKRSGNVKTSWYGESIGHYEDDALVVDTIGVDERTPVGGFGTPHTKELHVIERYHLIEDGNVLEVNVHVEDPGAFTVPWDTIQRFRQYEETMRNIPVERIVELGAPAEGPLVEEI